MAETKDTKVITGKVRFSYAKVWEPSRMDEDQKEKYSVAILISKKDKMTVDRIKKAIDAALEAGKEKSFGGKLPKAWKNPLRDGDEEKENDETYAGHYFVNANSVNKPGIVDAQLNPILDKTEFYSGCYGRASVNFYAFNTNGNKGIACGLNNLQKLEDGEPLGGSASKPEEDFADDLM